MNDDFEIVPVGTIKLLEQLRREVAAYQWAFDEVQARSDWILDPDKIKDRINGNQTK